MEFRPPWAEMPSGRAPRATPDDVVPVAAAQLLLSRVEEEEEEVEEDDGDDGDDGKSSLRSRLSIFSSTGSISVSFVDPEERLVPADSPTQTQARLEIKFFSSPTHESQTPFCKVRPHDDCQVGRRNAQAAAD